MELECNDLKRLVRFTKKGELQSKIDRKNEESDILKMGLSGIVKRYEFHTVHDFYKIYTTAKTAYVDYWNKYNRWEENYRENVQKQEKESVLKRLQNYQREKTNRQVKQTSKSKERGAI